MRATRLIAAVMVGFLAQAAIAADANAPVDVSQYAGPVKVACVGDSITHGSGASKGNSYPDQLRRMLGEKFEVKNFGVSGATLLNSGDRPYQKQKLYKAALAYEPDVVVIMLGTNDSKPQNWKHREAFEADYRELVGKFAALKSHPRIWVVLPCPVPNGGGYGITEGPVTEELPLIQEAAKALGTGLIDVHGAMEGHAEWFADNIHPKTAGATVLAGTVYQSLTGKAYSGPSPVVEALTSRPAGAGTSKH